MKKSCNKYITWNCYHIFSKVGLRVSTQDGQYEYFVAPKVGGVPTCGFRCSLFTWDDSTSTYIRSVNDDNFTSVISGDDIKASGIHISYSPYYRLVTQAQIDQFLQDSAVSIKPENFVHYIREQLRVIQDILPVLRDVQFTGREEIILADFSEVDMTRIIFRDMKSVKCIYNNARITYAQFTNTIMKNSWFMSTDMRGSVLRNVDLQGENSLTKCNFKNALLDEDTNLTDNYSFGQAMTDDALILNTKVLFTATEKISNLRNMLSKLVKAKEKKEEELTQKLVQMAEDMEKYEEA